MTIDQVVKLILESGMGVASFAAIMLIGYRGGQFLTTLTENHLVHLQASMDLVNDKLDKLIDVLTKKD